ncbi:MAG: ABC transporter substrate-binding protein [Anaerolineales bacterium]
MLRRSTGLLLILAAALTVGGCSEGSTRLGMGYRPDVQFAPLYVAAERGYYREAGIDIEFSHMPENVAVELVGAGELQFAIVSGEQVLMARGQGIPVVYVMAWWQDYPVGVVVPSGSGIASVPDLRGKQVGIPGLYGASYIGLRALLDAVEVSEEDLILDSIGYTQVEAMLAGLEQAAVIYVNNEPVQLQAQGMSVDVFRVADYVHLTSNGLITNEATIAEDPELVRAMISATLRGLQDALDDPDAAFEISTLYVEGLAEVDPTVPRAVLEESLPFWQAERLGYSDAEAWENMQQVLLSMGLLDQPLDLDQAFTNIFLP